MATAASTAIRGLVRPLSVAPMMDRTDRHFRVLARQFTRRTLLYTEMVTTAAVLHGDRGRLLEFSEGERPLSLQLGGDDPGHLAECARIAEGLGYDEVNLNVGCPSDRVQDGGFGACLMARPERVAACVESMRAAVPLPVTVKHRIGIDDRDRYEDLLAFVDVVAAAGCDRFTVHARKAVLGGLSPRQNREIPPLRPADVHRLKQERPHLVVELNGGCRSLEQARAELAHVDAVMIGRAAYDAPAMLARADALMFGDDRPPVGERDAALGMRDHAEWWLRRGGRLADVTRPLMGLFAGRPGAKAWRQRLSEGSRGDGAGPGLIEEALSLVEA